MKADLSQIFKPFLTPALSRICKFKDVHAGESCYLFGDGVSIKWFELGAFADKPSIPCGFLPLHKDFSKLEVSYLILMEPWWFYPYQKTTSPPVKYIKNVIQKMYRNQVLREYPEKTLFTNITNYPVLNRKNAVYTYKSIEDGRLPENYISYRVNCFAGSLRASILIAIYLGFDHCYLAGFDYTHMPSLSRHWYEKGQGIENGLIEHESGFLEQAKEYIDITTITVDAGSNTLDSLTYKKITGLEPRYHENTELVSAENLKRFSHWPGYTIY
jgi:hypothetical protein